MARIRVVDYIADFIEKELKVDKVFMVSGGGMMFLSDGIAMNPNISAICNHHEQACAMAASAYSKYTGRPGVAFLTTGCGGTNGITGLLNAYQDNAASFFITGQCKRKETVRNSGLKLRQFGVQEADIISVVESLTKYAVMINEPDEIAYHLEKALYLAEEGRPGPVWLDVPMDVQGAIIDTDELKHFNKSEMEQSFQAVNECELNEIKNAVEQAERPVIVAGQGIRLGKCINEFRCFIEKYNIPYVVSRLGIDLLPSGHPLFIGRIGNKGDRAGNFAVQNADLVLVLGSRLSVSSTGHEYDKFARAAKVIVVDIDKVEHQKNTVKIDTFLNNDVKDFLSEMPGLAVDFRNWAEKCLGWKTKWPVYQPEYANDSEGINLYYFIERLSKVMGKNASIISDAGSAFYVTSQGIMLDAGQRYITTGGQAEMGFSVPAAIGVTAAAPKGSQVIAITGDGSFQMNIQELQTIVYNKMPVKIFVWNNDGYLSIRASQRKFFNERYIGTDSTSGVSFPETEKIAGAYGIKYFKADRSDKLDEVIAESLAFDGPVICEVMCIRDQEIIPSVSSRKKADGTMVSLPIEDMYPFLPREEFLKEMIVAPIEE